MGRLFAAHASSEAVALETVLGIASPITGGGSARRRVYLHSIRVTPTAADFAADVDIFITPEYTGTNLITNGTFDSDTAWTKGADWSIAAGVASKVVNGATALEQAVSMANTPIVGDYFQLTYTLTKTANGITPTFAGDTAPADVVTGTYYPVLLAASTVRDLKFTADATAICDIDNVSLVKFGSSVAGSYWLKDSVRSGAVESYYRDFHSKQPYSTNGWSFVVTGAGAATIADLTVTYEVV